MTTHENDAVTTHEHSADPNPKGEHDPLTVAEISALFGVSVSTIRRLLADEKLPGATKRKGPKGDEWVIPPADMAALNYQAQWELGARFTDPQSRPTPAVPTAADYERQLAQLADTHALALQAEVARRESEVQALQAEVGRQTERAEYERLLRESAEVQANLAAALAFQAQKRTLELETATAKRRWLRKKKPAETPPQSET
jgi:hypothetical protein